MTPLVRRFRGEGWFSDHRSATCGSSGVCPGVNHPPPPGRHACVRLGKQSTGCLLLQVAPVQRSNAYQTPLFSPVTGCRYSLGIPVSRARARPCRPATSFSIHRRSTACGTGLDWTGRRTRSRSHGRRRREPERRNGRKSLRPAQRTHMDGRTHGRACGDHATGAPVQHCKLTACCCSIVHEP